MKASPKDHFNRLQTVLLTTGWNINAIWFGILTRPAIKQLVLEHAPIKALKICSIGRFLKCC